MTVKAMVMSVAGLGMLLVAGSNLPAVQVPANQVAEVVLTSGKQYAHPFRDVEVDALVSRPDGRQLRVPMFWAGPGRWCLRYASPLPGRHTYRVVSSDPTNTELHGAEGAIEVTAAAGDNPLYRHGPIRVGGDRRHFEHADGTPFFWLGDTWWKGLCKRLTWQGFQRLAADRRAKGFTVVQIVCGPYPDEGPFEPRWANEGGLPYRDRHFTEVNPAYFDYADRRLKHLVDAGLMPAIVGAWGRRDCDSMKNVGVEGLKRHWRHLVARYGAYPVVWILGGEIPTSTKWGQGPWAEVARYLRKIDPYHRLLTCHTYQGRRGLPDDETLIDFDMVCGNHDGNAAMSDKTLAILTSAYAVQPAMPVLCGETAYEGHMQRNFQYTQRHLFWMYMLSGAAGHTYGAAGIWHAGVEGDPGIRPIYDWTTWQQGMASPGATQLGLGKKLLLRYAWWRFEPHPEWVEPGCYAAGIAGQVRFIYMPRRKLYDWSGPLVKNLDRRVTWHVYYFDPATGRVFDQGRLEASTDTSSGKTATPVNFKKNVPSPQDWILVFERVKP